MNDVPHLIDGVTVGTQLVKLAMSSKEVEQCQRLRYEVFFEEMGAKPSPDVYTSRRDFDQYDEYCDHLMIIDLSQPVPEVVGTYRLLRKQRAEQVGGFYTSNEFNIDPLLAYPGEILELGRSCVKQKFRSRSTVQMLWRGIALYIMHYKTDLMFGCASFPGTDFSSLHSAMAYLYHHCLAPVGLRPRAREPFYHDMNCMAIGSFDPQVVWQSLPPLVKGYLRLGAVVGDGAVIDKPFNTTDVCVVVRTELITEKYTKHYWDNEVESL